MMNHHNCTQYHSRLRASLIVLYSLITPATSFASSNLPRRFRKGEVHVMKQNSHMDSHLEQGDEGQSQGAVKRHHHISICMVPPSHSESWKQITKAREQLKDPGLFRWPPHANLLYPFFDVTSTDHAIQKLERVVQRIEPFRCIVENFGTFGGSNRGVLYLYPKSFSMTERTDELEPLIQLQSELTKVFPECSDQLKHGSFTPHITLSHFTNVDLALEGQNAIEHWWEPIEFSVNEIYCLIRDGDAGQFERVITLPLGRNSLAISHDPPLRFPEMPLKEEDWVHEERMKLKKRRNRKGRGDHRHSQSNMQKIVDRGPSRTTDSPEEIARKRYERAKKKELLAAETASIEAAIRGYEPKLDLS